MAHWLKAVYHATLHTLNPRCVRDVPSVTAAGESAGPFVSWDGRYVLFSSTANNLCTTASNTPFASDMPARLNIFRRDRAEQITELVSINAAGRGGGNSDCVALAFSTNGQFVLFESDSDDLVAQDTNRFNDLFVRDLAAGTTRLITVAMDGGGANGRSRDATMTPDGRFVAFVSAATNLVADDTNRIYDVFVHDLEIGSTVLATPGAVRASESLCFHAPRLTPDGRFVLFLSSATNVVPGVTNAPGIYLRDLWNGVTHHVTAQIEPEANSHVIFNNHVLSDDGRFVAFQMARYFAPGNFDPLLSRGIFRFDRETAQLETVNTNPVIASINPFSSDVDMTADGRYVVYVAGTNSIVLADQTNRVMNLSSAVFMWDGNSGANSLVSGDPTGLVATNTECMRVSVDAAGTSVWFLCTATNLTTNTVSGDDCHVYVTDIATGTTRLVEMNGAAPGQGNAALDLPAVTLDGMHMAFDSTDPSIIPGDRNEASDVFYYDMEESVLELVSARVSGLPSLTPFGEVARGFR
jgi:Tol biopolymer transport system component